MEEVKNSREPKTSKTPKSPTRPRPVFRVIVTYSGFSETTDAALVRVVRKKPAQYTYDPVEAKRMVDFVFGSHRSATEGRTRLKGLLGRMGGFSISKVIDDKF